jgi:hypothetical protein
MSGVSQPLSSNTLANVNRPLYGGPTGSAGSGVSQIIAGTGIAINPTTGVGTVTVSATASGGPVGVTGTANQINSAVASGVTSLSLAPVNYAGATGTNYSNPATLQVDPLGRVIAATSGPFYGPVLRGTRSIGTGALPSTVIPGTTTLIGSVAWQAVVPGNVFTAQANVYGVALGQISYQNPDATYQPQIQFTLSFNSNLATPNPAYTDCDFILVPPNVTTGVVNQYIGSMVRGCPLIGNSSAAAVDVPTRLYVYAQVRGATSVTFDAGLTLQVQYLLFGSPQV